MGCVTPRVCENCAYPDEELVLVRRVYVTPETWDTPGTHRRLDDVEHWCFACCTHYPHERVDD